MMEPCPRQRQSFPRRRQSPRALLSEGGFANYWSKRRIDPDYCPKMSRDLYYPHGKKACPGKEQSHSRRIWLVASSLRESPSDVVGGQSLNTQRNHVLFAVQLGGNNNFSRFLIPLKEHCAGNTLAWHYRVRKQGPRE